MTADELASLRAWAMAEHLTDDPSGVDDPIVALLDHIDALTARVEAAEADLRVCRSTRRFELRELGRLRPESHGASPALAEALEAAGDQRTRADTAEKKLEALESVAANLSDTAKALRREVEQGIAIRQSTESKLARADCLESASRQILRAARGEP